MSSKSLVGVTSGIAIVGMAAGFQVAAQELPPQEEFAQNVSTETVDVPSPQPTIYVTTHPTIVIKGDTQVVTKKVETKPSTKSGGSSSSSSSSSNTSSGSSGSSTSSGGTSGGSTGGSTGGSNNPPSSNTGASG